MFSDVLRVKKKKKEKGFQCSISSIDLMDPDLYVFLTH